MWRWRCIRSDERYTSLVGKRAILPLANRPIPIIADEYSDPEKGTGAVKITPAHDFNDFEVGKRHGLAPLNILTKEAALNDLPCPRPIAAWIVSRRGSASLPIWTR